MGTPQCEDVEPERRKHFSMEGVVPGVKSAEGSTSHGQGLLVTLKAVLEAFQRLNHSIQYRQLFLKFFWE